MTKYEYVKDITAKASVRITKDINTFKSFLRSAAGLYKYPFDEQIMIYAQRPDAIACASIRTWNKRLKCWVNAGSKGIAIIDKDSENKRLKYVFDISDVHPGKGVKLPKLWKMNTEHENGVKEYLSSIYSIPLEKDFTSFIAEFGDALADDMVGDVIEVLTDNLSGSFAEDLDDDNLVVHVKETLSQMCAYTILSRCGYEIAEDDERFSFDYISEFNTRESIIALGDAAAEFVKPILQGIEREIKNIDKQVIFSKTIAKNSEMLYNQEKEIQEDKKGGQENGIHESRRLSAAEHQTPGAGGRTETVRPVEKEVPERAQTSNIYSDASQRDSVAAFDGDTAAGRGETGPSDGADGKGTGSDRGTESERPNALGAENEQHQSRRRGGSPSRDCVQLTMFPVLPTEEEQKEAIEKIGKGAEKSAPFSYLNPKILPVPGEYAIDVLKRGSGFAGGKLRIAKLYDALMSRQDRTKALKEEYGQGGCGWPIEGLGLTGYDTFSGKGIRVQWKDADGYCEGIITWTDAERIIEKLVSLDKYFTEDDRRKFHLDEIEVGNGIDTNQKISTEPTVEVTFSEHPGIEKGIYSFAYFNSLSGELDMLQHEQREIIEDIGWYYKTDYVVRCMIDGQEYTYTGRYDIGDGDGSLLSHMQNSEAEGLCEGNISDKLLPYLEEHTELTSDEENLVSERLKSERKRIGAEEIPERSYAFEYSLLGRLKADCEYYLGNGNRSVKHLWAIGPTEQIAKMRELYNMLPVKPEWLTSEDIDNYELQMIPEGEFLLNKAREKYSQAVDLIENEPSEINIEAAKKAKDEYEEVRISSIMDATEKSGEKYSDVILSEMESMSDVDDRFNIAVHGLTEDMMVTAQEYGEEASKDLFNGQNFRITDSDIQTGSPKEKYRSNIDAIKLVKKLETENRPATLQEQEVLSHYVGWGGLADAFDDRKDSWTNEYKELKELLTDDEYTSARASTLNAHYTSPVIIKQMYKVLENSGFKEGSILEPACGTGNFIGMLPNEMQASRFYGVELDRISGTIAKYLYPDANIQITGFEKTSFSDGQFDVAIGNVPFGQYKVNDKAFDKQNMLIHDYFIAKSIDKVKPGGIVAVITSKGTMDKVNGDARLYFAQRADLVGAVRLPNTAFKANAGTEVTSDILFFQKRDELRTGEMPDWVETAENSDGIRLNKYFINHPEMIVGTMQMVSGPYGPESACVPMEGVPFEVQLDNAIQNIHCVYDKRSLEPELENDFSEEPAYVIAETESVRDYSYTLMGDKLFFREGPLLNPVDVNMTAEERIKALIPLRDCLRELIDLQLSSADDKPVAVAQQKLNSLYDSFTKEYGYISSTANKRAFNQDSSYCLLCSLEKFDDDGEFLGKADIFSKRTIKKPIEISSVDTSSEALAVSLSQKGHIDLPYMAELSGKDVDTIISELTGVVFKNPITMEYETADEYLSGNVRNKLELAKAAGDEYKVNVASLEKVQPKDLTAAEIDLRLGATWIEPKYINEFMWETFKTPNYYKDEIKVQYSDITGEWRISAKSLNSGPIVDKKFGTPRANAYKILEDSLNLKNAQIFDTIEEDGKEKRVLNKKETTLASQRQDLIKEEFRSWVFKDPERRRDLCDKYNRIFNSTRPREYYGSHLTFPGMNPEISLRQHQKNAVARILYGGNTLLAHVVGAGKTFEMAAAAMESKRIGLCHKSLFVVPNHLTEQWGAEFLTLYPGANILVATKKDFEPANRKKFCSRIATGDYDAVIIGHSQFEKIPLSKERQEKAIQGQIDEITLEIDRLKYERGERFTVKQMEKLRKSLEVRLEKLGDISQDNVINFEELGVDRLFVDESHNYKNLYLYTKMRNVAGISATEAKKSSDMYAKCQYIDEITGNTGITFATGTPISNSMTEMYTNMRYLQSDKLKYLNLSHFDSWASTFGETQTAIELAPEGTGYRMKTRFAKFFNLPELMNIFKEAADIQTADMLNLPRPKANYHNVVLKPSEVQKEIVQSLAERAEAVRNGLVEPNEDNMLKITNDGRKLALEQRLIDEGFVEDPESKTIACVNNAFKIWEDTKEEKAAQLIFCDLSTPKNDGSYNVYSELKERLMAKGVPEKEIAFIHDAKTDAKKAELFSKVRSGQVRFLIGSTAKMGAGTNVQDRLVALHHLDVPWRPSDIEQQEGRILRQGNRNKEVEIFRYIKEGTFDSYSWQVLENKAKFIGQIMTSKSPVRAADDIDDAALTCAEVKALASGNPLIKEKMDLDVQVSKLKLLKANYENNLYQLQDDISTNYPAQIVRLKQYEAAFGADIEHFASAKPADDSFQMTVFNKTYDEKKLAGAALIEACKKLPNNDEAEFEVGEYLGFRLLLSKQWSWNGEYHLNIKGAASHSIDLGSDPLGNITRINNALESMGIALDGYVQKRQGVEKQLEEAEEEVKKPFAHEAEFKEKMLRLNELNNLLDADQHKGKGNIAEDDKMLSIVKDVCTSFNITAGLQMEQDNEPER